jgi:hypothetical protein
MVVYSSHRGGRESEPLVTIEYYVSTCPRQGYSRQNPAGLFRCVWGESWLSAHYLDECHWRLSDTLAHEMAAGYGPLERIGFEEAMAVLASRGGRPDSIDERAGAGRPPGEGGGSGRGAPDSAPGSAPVEAPVGRSRGVRDPG